MRIEESFLRKAIVLEKSGVDLPALLFLGVATIFVLSFGPFNSAFNRYHIAWNFLCLLGSFSILIASRLTDPRGQRSGCEKFVSILAVGLSLVIFFVSFSHSFAMQYQPLDQPLNFAGLTIAGWENSHFNFTLFYLFFPLLFLLNLSVIKNVPLVFISRALASLLFLSVVVQFYQGFIDDTFLNKWGIGSERVGGLATDPNSYALITLLVLPIVFMGSLFDSVRWRLWQWAVCALILSGLFLAGNRTALGAWVLMISCIPLAYAFSSQNMRGWLRALFMAMPVVAFFSLFYLLTQHAAWIEGLGLLGQRISSSWAKLSDAGLKGLFFQGEARGGLILVGLALLMKSPLAGWGPGGFYREYANEYYRLTGEIQGAFDSVLNHYLMVAIDFGLPALFLYLCLMLTPLVMGVLLFRKISDLKLRFSVFVLVLSQVIFLLAIVTIPPAYFPDLIWIWTLSLAISCVLGVQAGVLDGFYKKILVYRLHLKGFIGFLLIVSVISGYSVTFGGLGYKARLLDSGSPLTHARNCYGVEVSGTNRWQWCNRNSRVKLPLTTDQQGELALVVVAANPDLKDRPLEVKYGGLSGPTQTIMLTVEQPSAQIRIPLDRAHVVEVAAVGDKPANRFAVLSLDVSHTWVPKEMGVSGDTRVLGVSVQLPEASN